MHVPKVFQHRRNDCLFLTGQFTSQDMPSIKRADVKRIISLRTEGEVAWDEQSTVETSGLEFVSVPFSGPGVNAATEQLK